MAYLLGPPPKVIGLVVGNCTTLMIERLLKENAKAISVFENDPQSAFMPIA